MSDLVVRTLSSVVMTAATFLAVRYRKTGLHTLLGLSQVSFVLEISKLPASTQLFRAQHCLGTALMVAIVLCLYYNMYGFALISFGVMTIVLLGVLFRLTTDFKDSLAAFLLILADILIAGGLSTVGHLLIEENENLFISELVLVAVNDVMAYICGRTLGRHALIKLSPSKTWEGYIGALLSTIAAGAALPRLLEMLQPDDSLTHRLPFLIQAAWIGAVGPIGGFFGSLVKRASGVKDFGSTIPGHGGFVDRWDCQLPAFVLSFLVSRVFSVSE